MFISVKELLPKEEDVTKAQELMELGINVSEDHFDLLTVNSIINANAIESIYPITDGEYKGCLNIIMTSGNAISVLDTKTTLLKKIIKAKKRWNTY